MGAAGVARRPLAKTCILLLAGDLAAQHTTLLLTYDALCLCLVASILALAKPRLRAFALPALGWTLFMVSGVAIVEGRLDARYAGDSMLVKARVVDFPRWSGSAVTITLSPLDDARVPERIRVSWFEAPVMPRIGETWELELRLRRPRGALNPGGFDVETWYFREKYHASGYVVAGQRNRLLWAGDAPPLDRFRARFVARAKAAAGSPQTAAVLAALGVGARHLVSRDQWDRFAATGTSHLMAISGLHVGLAALVGFAIVFVAAVLVPVRGNHFLAAVLLGVVMAGSYALASGLGVPSRRAVIMLLVAAVSVARRRRVDPVAVVAFAAAVVFISDPIATLTPGYHLSFAAVVSLLWLARRRAVIRWRAGGPLTRLVSMQVFLLFAMMPLTVLIFGRFAVLATPVNLVAVPVFSLVTVPVTIAAGVIGEFSDAASIGLLRIAGLSIGFVDSIIRFAAAVPHLDGNVAELDGIAWLFLAMPLAWVLLPPAWPGRGAAVLGVLALATWKPPAPPEGCFDSWVLDVGQGLAVVVGTAKDTTVYDTGMAWRGGGSAAEQVILPFLARRGIDEINRLVVSHADLDHSGGAGVLLEHAAVGQVFAGEPVPGLRALACARGEGWRSGAVRFEFLHPGRRGRADGNNASCVLRVSAGRHSLLLTGDIERPAERELLAARTELGADVVVVPHHGSRTSSSPSFVEAVDPMLAVVSAGHANRWGFPEPGVVSRWRSGGASLLSTASDGAVFLRVCAAGGVVDIATERQRRRRFWHDES
jgi:competence protein ComEC